MTNHTDIKAMIDERVQGRDIEKLFDGFVETVTDLIMDEIKVPEDDEGEATELIDYIVEKVFENFNLRSIK